MVRQDETVSKPTKQMSSLHALNTLRLTRRRRSRFCCCFASTPPRIFCSPLPQLGERVLLQPEEAKHAAKVLRLAAGARVDLFDGAGGLVTAQLGEKDKSGVFVTATNSPRLVPESGPLWTVACACVGLPGGRSDWLVEKLSELGAAELLPLLTVNTQASSERCGELARWRRLATAAAKQSLRLHSLRVSEPLELAALLPSLAGRIALVALQGAPPLKEQLAQLGVASQAGGVLLVGPPGDFSEAEKTALIAAGAVGVGLGNLRLRTETAALALVAACTL